MMRRNQRTRQERKQLTVVAGEVAEAEVDQEGEEGSADVVEVGEEASSGTTEVL